MSRFARLLLMLLVTAFAATSIMQPAYATAMSLQPASVAAEAMVSDMPDCAACPTDSAAGAAACDLLCTFAFSATLATAALGDPHFASVERIEQRHDFFGRVRSPDPHPPRAALLP